MELGRLKNYGYKSYRLILNFKVGKDGNCWSRRRETTFFSYVSSFPFFFTQINWYLDKQSFCEEKGLCLLSH